MHNHWSKSQGLASLFPLHCHLLDTAASMAALWDLWLRPGLRELIAESMGLPEAQARKWVMFAGAMHDIGKASPVFSGQKGRGGRLIDDNTKRLADLGYDFNVPIEDQGCISRHEKVSALYLGGQRLRDADPVADNWLPTSALGHHGHFNAPSGPDIEDVYEDTIAESLWEGAARELESLIAAALGIGGEDRPSSTPTATVLISGLVILADRTASELQSVRAAQADMAKGHLDAEKYRSWIDLRSEYFATRIRQTLGIYNDFIDGPAAILPQGTPRPLQAAAASRGDGLWIAMAPTGSGKTEAALLRHCTKPERLIFALPTVATTNAMMKRIQAIYRDTGNVAELSHGLATVEDFYRLDSQQDTAGGTGGLIPSDFVTDGTARLIAPVSVATIDQVLRGAIRGKWNHLRLLSLANAHIVIDEAHLMDAYQTRLVRELMTWWGATKTRVTVLTATLPKWQRDAFSSSYDPDWVDRGISFPAHEMVPGEVHEIDHPSYQIGITTEETEDSTKAHLEWVTRMRATSPGARLGVVVNTINRAQLLAEQLNSAGVDCIVLHSRMTAEHRRKITDGLLNAIGKRGEATGLVLIGTQAIEASLDIDLDAMSTDLSPAPSIIQRAGRVWRHQDSERRNERLPGFKHLPLHVVKDTSKSGHHPYFLSELKRTFAWLEGKTHIAMPEDSQDFVETSAISYEEAELEQADFEELARASQLSVAARGVAIDIKQALAPDAELYRFGYLTQRNALAGDEAGTRYIDNLTATAILIAPTSESKIPGAWIGDAFDLQDIDTGHRSQNKEQARERLRSVMGATIPVNGKLASKLLELRPSNWDPRHESMKRMIPLHLGDSGFSYDPTLGLMWSEPKEDE